MARDGGWPVSAVRTSAGTAAAIDRIEASDYGPGPM
jgi:hypothetical protein